MHPQSSTSLDAAFCGSLFGNGLKLAARARTPVPSAPYSKELKRQIAYIAWIRSLDFCERCTGRGALPPTDLQQSEHIARGPAAGNS